MNNQEIQDREENIEKRNAILAKKKELANVKFNFKNYTFTTRYLFTRCAKEERS